jgi:hypothetical protein
MVLEAQVGGHRRQQAAGVSAQRRVVGQGGLKASHRLRLVGC